MHRAASRQRNRKHAVALQTEELYAPWCLTVCCLLLFAPSFTTATAIAQETTATVTGTVTDQSGGVLPGVSVSLRHVATGRVAEGISGAEGGYLLPALPIGAYEATLRCPASRRGPSAASSSM